MSKDFVEKVLGAVFSAILSTLFFGLSVYWGWNNGLCPIAGVPEITFAQSLWLTCLTWGLLRPVIPQKFNKE